MSQSTWSALLSVGFSTFPSIVISTISVKNQDSLVTFRTGPRLRNRPAIRMRRRHSSRRYQSFSAMRRRRVRRYFFVNEIGVEISIYLRSKHSISQSHLGLGDLTTPPLRSHFPLTLTKVICMLHRTRNLRLCHRFPTQERPFPFLGFRSRAWLSCDAYDIPVSATNLK